MSLKLSVVDTVPRGTDEDAATVGNLFIVGGLETAPLAETVPRVAAFRVSGDGDARVQDVMRAVTRAYREHDLQGHATILTAAMLELLERPDVVAAMRARLGKMTTRDWVIMWAGFDKPTMGESVPMSFVNAHAVAGQTALSVLPAGVKAFEQTVAPTGSVSEPAVAFVCYPSLTSDGWSVGEGVLRYWVWIVVGILCLMLIVVLCVRLAGGGGVVAGSAPSLRGAT